MIAVDTNILLRYFVTDDPSQAKLVADFFDRRAVANDPVFVGLITLVETLWVLADTYKASKVELRDLVEKLIDAPYIVLQSSEIVTAALRLEQGDIADRLIHLVGKTQGCTHTLTFDKRFARIDGVELLTAGALKP